MKKEKEDSANAPTPLPQEIVTLLGKAAKGYELISDWCEEAMTSTLVNDKRVEEAFQQIRDEADNYCAQLAKRAAPPQTSELGWKERIELRSIIGFCVGALEGIECQATDDLRVKIRSVIEEVTKREQRAALTSSASSQPTEEKGKELT